MGEVKHTLDGEYGLTYNDVMSDIMNNKLDIRVENDPFGLLLIGNLDDIKYLIENVYGITN